MRHFIRPTKQQGVTLVEVLITIGIVMVLVSSLGGVLHHVFQYSDEIEQQDYQQQSTQLAIERIVHSVSRSNKLLLPSFENPNTNQSEAVRTVLAFSLNALQDHDGDGFMDADDDRDGRIDEDSNADMNNDVAPGIKGIDDDNDGQIDEGDRYDDDEDGLVDEEILNNYDDDGDGRIDEDLARDFSQDNKPGLAEIDDDGDNSMDEGSVWDDDEDGKKDEDPMNVSVFYLKNNELIERVPRIHHTNGKNYTERVLLTGVTEFTVTYLSSRATNRPLLQVKLTVLDSNNESQSQQFSIRVGSEV